MFRRHQRARSEPEPQVELPPIDPKMMAHFVAIQSKLTPEEGQLAREVAKDLTPVQLREWMDSLSKLGVDEAVAMIRQIIVKNGGAA